MLVILAAVTHEKVLLPDNADGETIWPSVATENSLHPRGRNIDVLKKASESARRKRSVVRGPRETRARREVE